MKKWFENYATKIAISLTLMLITALAANYIQTKEMAVKVEYLSQQINKLDVKLIAIQTALMTRGMK